MNDNAVKAPDGKPRFEFYKILPGSEEPVTDQQLKQAAQRPSVQDKYFLQAGSFQKAEDADNLKAKLAMIGIEATGQAPTCRGKVLWHRVRVGPFSSVDAMNEVRASLQQNGVQSSIIKVERGAVKGSFLGRAFSCSCLSQGEKDEFIARSGDNPFTDGHERWYVQRSRRHCRREGLHRPVPSSAGG